MQSQTLNNIYKFQITFNIMNEKYLLVSLEEEKSKQLANVLSNDTSRKILDYLAEKDISETDLAKELNLPLSTVHYNVQNLLKNNLVEIKDFVYSEKGNKINIYKLSRKLIIIAPKGVEIKNILPVVGISLLASGIIYLLTKTPVQEAATNYMKSAALEASAMPAIQIAITPNYAAWFLAGSIFTIILYAVINYIRNRK